MRVFLFKAAKPERSAFFHAGLSTKTVPQFVLRHKIERSAMKKIVMLAIAGLFTVSTLHATLVREQFATDPALDGWQMFGDTNLFQWDSTNHVLDVTWDSTQTNSYFYYPLDKTYTRADSFCVLFDLQLNDATNYNEGMELAVGLLNFADATNSVFSRANFISTNLCEFDYFPQFYDSYSMTTYPDSVEATMIDDSGEHLFQTYDNFTLNPGVTYRIVVVHEAGAATISAEAFTNGQLVDSFPITASFGAFGDFELDTLAVISYSDDGYGDSILAHGSVGDLAFASPVPVGLIQTLAAGQIQFASDTNWLYTLQQTADFQAWTPLTPPVFGNGTNMLLQDPNPPACHSFYRVNAQLP
jgi:hypothetical protein